MSRADWLARWQQGRIGFHRDAHHPALDHYWPSLAVAAPGKVLVPLCGKSHDMRWLARQGHAVLGVELSPLAIAQFVSESPHAEEGAHGVLRYSRAGFECTRQGAIELWCGDFFHFPLDEAASLAAFYDRAALIALPPAMRQRYVFHLAQLMNPGSVGLMVSLTHDDPERGPPFSVDASEVERLLSPNFEIACCETGPRAPDGVREQVWRLIRRGPRG